MKKCPRSLNAIHSFPSVEKRRGVPDEGKISTKLISLRQFQTRASLSWKLWPSMVKGQEDAGERLDGKTSQEPCCLYQLMLSHRGEEEKRGRLIAL